MYVLDTVNAKAGAVYNVMNAAMFAVNNGADAATTIDQLLVEETEPSKTESEEMELEPELPKTEEIIEENTEEDIEQVD